MATTLVGYQEAAASPIKLETEDGTAGGRVPVHQDRQLATVIAQQAVPVAGLQNEGKVIAITDTQFASQALTRGMTLTNVGAEDVYVGTAATPTAANYTLKVGASVFLEVVNADLVHMAADTNPSYCCYIGA